jgi:hypothetical protein
MSSALAHRRILLAVVAGVVLFVGQGMAFADTAGAPHPTAPVGVTIAPPSFTAVWSWLANFWGSAGCLAGWTGRCTTTVGGPQLDPRQDNGCSVSPNGSTCIGG